MGKKNYLDSINRVDATTSDDKTTMDGDAKERDVADVKKEVSDDKEKSTPPEGGGSKEEQTIDEQKFIEFFNQQNNTSFTSLEEISKPKEVEKIIEKEVGFANETIKGINEFVKETNRPVKDYFLANEDLSQISDNDKILRLIQYEENLSKEDAQFILDDDYAKQEIDEDMDEEEISLIKRKNKRIEIKYKKKVKEANEYLTKLQEKYKAPVIPPEQKSIQEREQVNTEFKNNIDNSINNFNEISFGDYTHKIGEEDKQSLKAGFTSIEEVINSFKDENGNFDYNEFLTTIYVGRNRNAITKNISSLYKDEGKTEVINSMRNNTTSSANVNNNTGTLSDKEIAAKKSIEDFFLNKKY